MPESKALITAEELRRAGWKALVDTLGPTNATRFILQYERGSGDYVKMRDELLGKKNLEELYGELAKKKSKPS
jgi:hypothetical protein